MLIISLCDKHFPIFGEIIYIIFGHNEITYPAATSYKINAPREIDSEPPDDMAQLVKYAKDIIHGHCTQYL